MKSKSIRDLLVRTPNAVEQGRLDMFESLMNAVYGAGGDIVGFEDRVLCGMTVIELIDALGQNDVRFCLISKEF